MAQAAKRNGTMTAQEYTEQIAEIFNGDHPEAARLLGITRASSYYYASGHRPVSLAIQHSLLFIRALGVEEARKLIQVRRRSKPKRQEPENAHIGQ